VLTVVLTPIVTLSLLAGSMDTTYARCRRGLTAARVTRQLGRVHAAQIRARTPRQRRRVASRVRRVRADLICLLRHRRASQREAAADLLVSAVVQSSAPGQPGTPRLYPRMTKRNHDRLNAAADRNLCWLMQTAAGLARRRGHRRQLARRMLEAARPQRYGALRAHMTAARRLGDRETARRSALQAILAFWPADRLVLDREARVATTIGRRQAAGLARVLWTARDRRPGNLAFQELRREDSRYFGWTAGPRLQAMAFLARHVRGRPARLLARELAAWQEASGLTLKSAPGDKWIPASYTARSSGRGVGYLVARTLLARRK
jgi:hypothetical protein